MKQKCTKYTRSIFCVEMQISMASNHASALMIMSVLYAAGVNGFMKLILLAVKPTSYQSQHPNIQSTVYMKLWPISHIRLGDAF